MAFIVEIPNGNEFYWLAPWGGDPGRTLVRENARQFKTESAATKALKAEQKKWPERRSLIKGTVIRLTDLPLSNPL